MLVHFVFIPLGPFSEQCLRLREMTMVLIGLPQSGKSSSGNTILGSNKFKSERTYKAVSRQCATGSATVGGCQVTVVDAPGFSDEVESEKQLCDEIRQAIPEDRPGTHAFVLVVKIGRINKSDSALLNMLSKLLKFGACNYTVVLFTHEDELKGQSVDEMIQDKRCVAELVSACGRRYCMFDNTRRDIRHQVQRLMRTIDHMVAQNNQQFCTRHMLTLFYKAARSNNTMQCKTLYTLFKACCCCCSTSGSSEEQAPLLQRNYGSVAASM